MAPPPLPRATLTLGVLLLSGCSYAYVRLPQQGGMRFESKEPSSSLAVEGALRTSIRVHLILDVATFNGEIAADIRALIASLRADDQIQIIVAQGTARQILSPMLVGDGTAVLSVLAQLNSRPYEQTNLTAALQLASETAHPESSLVVLLTDVETPPADLAASAQLLLEHDLHLSILRMPGATPSWASSPRLGDRFRITTVQPGSLTISFEAEVAALVARVSRLPAPQPQTTDVAAVHAAIVPDASNISVHPPRSDGSGHSLMALTHVGVTLDGQIAALDRFVPLPGMLEGIAAGDSSLRLELAGMHSSLPARGGETRIVLRVSGGAANATPPPMRVHLVIDTSVSMASTFDQLKEAALSLVGRLRPEDELQIVVYGTDAREVLPPISVDDGSRARAVIRALAPSGRTNIEAGLRLAYRALSPAGSLVLLLSDGVPTGGLSEESELGTLAATARTEGATTSAIGIGWDFHPGILAAIAAHGGGGFRISPTIGELSALLTAELEVHARVTARHIEAVVRLPPGVVLSDELPTGAKAMVGGLRIELPALAQGETLTYALPVRVSEGRGARGLAELSAEWRANDGSHRTANAALTIATSPEPVLASAAFAALDAKLVSTLRVVGQAITRGDTEVATERFDHYVREMEEVIAARPLPELRARVATSSAFSAALRTFLPRASWPDRRAMGARTVEFAAAFGR